MDRPPIPHHPRPPNSHGPSSESMDKPPTPHRPRPPNSPTTCLPPPASHVSLPEELSSTEWAQVYMLGEDSYQNWLSCLPPLPQVSSSLSSQPGSCEEPCTSAHAGQASSSKEHSSSARAQLFKGYHEGLTKTTMTTAPTPTPPTLIPATCASLTTCSSPSASPVPSSEEFSETEWAQLLGEDAYQKLLISGVPPLPPKVSPSLSSQPRLCGEPCTSAHAGQASSSEEQWASMDSESLTKLSELESLIESGKNVLSELTQIQNEFLSNSSSQPGSSGGPCTSAQAGQGG